MKNHYARHSLLLGLWLILCAANAMADAAPVAMLLKASGKVTILMEDDTAKGRPPPPFAKLAPGALLELAGDAQLQLVYFANGRKEQWWGPARIKISANASEGLSDGISQPRISQLPKGAGLKLSRLPESIDIATIQRGGLIVVRGAPRKRTNPVPPALIPQWDSYKTLRKTSPQNDWTADLYWLGVLLEAGEDALYQSHLKQTLARFPDLAAYLKEPSPP